MSTGPDFLLIGAARSGTSWVARALDEHPLLSITDPKEPHFLALGGEPPRFAGPGDALVARQVTESEAAWRSLFERSDPAVLVGDASVSTLYYPDVTVDRIAALCPAAMLIVVLRRPWERARSAWTRQVGVGHEELDFESALAAEDDRIAAGYHLIWHYRHQSEYSVQLQQFLERFPGQVLVLDYDTIASDPDRLVGDVHDFLGVDRLPAPDLGRVNVSSRPGLAVVRRVMTSAHAHVGVRRVVHALVPWAARRRLIGALGRIDPAPSYPADFIDSFAPELERLQGLLGDAAPEWCREVPVP